MLPNENNAPVNDPGPRDQGHEGFFGVVVRKQTYLNALYLYISFPLGLAYFSFLVGGFSAGLGLAVVGIGLVILFFVLAALRGLAVWESWLGIWLLDARISAAPAMPVSWHHPWEAFKTYLGEAATWKGLFFLLIKFPLGIVSFVISVTLTAVSLSLIFTPLLYRIVPIDFFYWQITRTEEALLCLALGLLLGILTLYVMNGLAFVWRRLAIAFLDNGSAPPETPAPRGPIVIE